MKGSLVIMAAILGASFMILSWQAGSYAQLNNRAQDKEKMQINLIDTNNKLEAELRFRTNRASIDREAERLGLVKVEPEQRLHVVIGGKARSP